MPSFISSATHLINYPLSDNEIVFVGKSNVGKSSLINCLYKKGLAYVGKTPGKTKLLNFFDIDSKYTVCDVPGYGFANRSQKELIEFGRMMEEYFTKRSCIRLVVLIFDIRRDLNNDDLDMIDYLKDKKHPYIIVFNKIDKLSNNELFNRKRYILSAIDDKINNLSYVSAEKRTNIDDLKKIIESYLVY